MKNPSSRSLTMALITLALAGAVSTLLAGTSGTPAAKSAYTTGQKAPAFQARTVDGKTINFPGDYKGKLVLLDFWATWCEPCRQELPNVVAAYQEYHAKGFEVLGVSLDRPGQGPKLIQFAKDNNMPWPQVYDGKYWKADLAVQYCIRSIPRPILVDGDSGLIVAEGPAARASKLGGAISRGLMAKGKKG